MLRELNEQLVEINEKARQIAKWERRVADYRKQLEEGRQKAAEMRGLAECEEKDAARLEGLSFSNLLHTLLGDKQERISEEQLEALRARLKEEEARQTVEQLEDEIRQLENRLKDVQQLLWIREQIRKNKIKWIEEHHYAISEDLYDLSEKEAQLKLVLKELEEAVQAGEMLQSELGAAAECVSSAKGWGTFDVLGGGVIATAVKHRRMEDARHHIRVAGRRLHQFEKELQDLSMHEGLEKELEIQGALAFADFFFDGLVVDWIVQGRVEKSYQQVKEKIHETGRLMHRLAERKTAVEAELRAVHSRYLEILDQAEDEPADRD